MAELARVISPSSRAWLRSLDEDSNVNKTLLSKMKDIEKSPDLPRVLTLVAALFDGADLRLQGRAAILLGRFDNPATQALLQVLLNHADVRVRTVAVEAAQIADTLWGLRVCLARLKDSDPRVAQRAVELCRKWDRKWLKSMLQQLLDQGDTTSLTEVVECLTIGLDVDLLDVFEYAFCTVDVSLKRRLVASLIPLAGPAVNGWAWDLLERTSDPLAKEIIEQAYFEMTAGSEEPLQEPEPTEVEPEPPAPPEPPPEPPAPPPRPAPARREAPAAAAPEPLQQAAARPPARPVATPAARPAAGPAGTTARSAAGPRPPAPAAQVPQPVDLPVESTAPLEEPYVSDAPEPELPTAQTALEEPIDLETSSSGSPRLEPELPEPPEMPELPEPTIPEMVAPTLAPEEPSRPPPPLAREAGPPAKLSEPKPPVGPADDPCGLAGFAGAQPGGVESREAVAAPRPPSPPPGRPSRAGASRPAAPRLAIDIPEPIAPEPAGPPPPPRTLEPVEIEDPFAQPAPPARVARGAAPAARVRVEMPAEPEPSDRDGDEPEPGIEADLGTGQSGLPPTGITILPVDPSVSGTYVRPGGVRPQVQPSQPQSSIRVAQPPAAAVGSAAAASAVLAGAPARPPGAPVKFTATDRERLFGLLRVLAAKGGSDLHLKAGMNPYIRLGGRMIKLPNPPLTPADLLACIASITNPDQLDRFQTRGDLDLSVSLTGTGRFRLSVLRTRGVPGLVARLIPSEVPSIIDLHLPVMITQLAREPSGLLLVAGPTGSGKSTTLAVIIDQINATRQSHIVTLEDPVEFLHRDKLSTVTQRQVGTDVPNFADGIRFAQKMDPDVIMVGELRDLETIRAAFYAAGAGRLVLATVHTNSAAKTVERIVYAFPTAEQPQARVNLSMTLLAVVNQTLVRTIRGGVVPAVELLVANHAIRKAIRDDNTQSIVTAMESGAQEGMVTLDHALVQLFQTGQITRSEALRCAPNPIILEHLLM
ncbi:MAG: PilT/PilU family type 4a pilus ATPase [Candidatus Riflebacteria bacterium]|nr:PilT/PilU family type 4a pilus ATPase [Candidatus Riflebacteria bacterium]